MTGDVKGWIPQLYLDEWVPPCRPTPADWLVLGDVVRIARVDDDEDEPGPVVAHGETVTFSRNTIFGTAELRVHSEGFSVNPSMPAEANCCRLAYDNEYICDSVDALVQALRESGDYDSAEMLAIEYYAWDDFEFRLDEAQLVAVPTP